MKFVRLERNNALAHAVKKDESLCARTPDCSVRERKPRRMKVITPVRKGFTLIELLVVIAIIAILAAILFPVFARVREQSRQTNCFSNMHGIYVALRIYREDNNKYPSALLGYVQDATGVFYTTGNGNIPAQISSLTYKPLISGQKYLNNDPSIFVCPDTNHNRVEYTGVTDITTAVYPVPLARAGNFLFTQLVKDNCCRAVPIDQPAYFYKYDSYDIGPQINASGVVQKNGADPIYELHYALDWTGKTGTADATNQLKYPNAPEDRTVITWCTYHAGYAGSDKVLTLMLNGKVRPVSASEFVPKGPIGLVP